MSPRPSAPLTLEFILLGLLDQRPMHGYDLHRELTSLAGINLIWSVKQSRLYALLDKLEQGGLLASELIPGEAHPARKQFHLTERGRQSLHAWMLSPVQHGREMRQDFLARLYFAQRKGLQTAQRLIQDQRLVCLGWQAHLGSQVGSLREESQFERLVYEFRIAQVKAMLDWLDACQEELSG
jgi:DNA-binding PadR family transcriptional regulator